MKKTFALTIAGAVALAVTVVPTAASAQTPTDPSIAELAQSNGLTTLVTAVTAAGLADELSDCSYGPVTVFAPDNAAFEKLPADLLKGALDDPDGLLTSVLTYHVVPGTLLAADVLAATSLTTALGQTITVDGANATLNGNVKITGTDITACNGVVHTIDSVLVPTLPSIADIAGGSGFSTLLAAVQAAGLAEALDNCSADPITVFAPTDAAFAAALAALGLTAEQVLGNTELLTTILTYHVVPGIAAAAEVVGSTSLTTLQSEAISVNGTVLNGNVNITATDIWACNGVVHVIDAVLLPPSLTEPAPTTTVAPTTTTPVTELPATGNENTVMVLIASILLLGGVALVATRRRSTV